MSVGSLVSVEDYLKTDYSPDCDYVDGEIVGRNVGERPHSLVQSNVIFSLRSRYKGIRVWPEQRIQVAATRFRVLDVCVTLDDPGVDTFTVPPLIVIEILSQEDRMSRIEEKIDDYLLFGVPYVWVIDPRRRTGHVCDGKGMHKVLDGEFVIDSPDIRLPLAELFI